MIVTFDDLGDDIIEIIIGYVKHYNSLALLKMTCLRTHNHISRYSIAILMLSSRLGQFSFRVLCINDDCYEDTYRVFKLGHNRFNSRYIHHRQNALNTSAIIFNEKYYNINSHYCCECFKKFVLVGSNTDVIETYHHDNYQQVNVSF